MIQFKCVCFMWFKVTIFHAEWHTLLIQSSRKYFAYSPLSAAILLVLCGQTLVSCSHSFLPVDHAVRRKKEAGYARPARPLFCARCYHFQYKLKAITPCATEEWSGHARLQPVLHGFFLFWDHYFIDFSIGCNIGKMMAMRKTTVQLQFGGKPCILLQSTFTTTYQVTIHVKQSIWSHKQAACSCKNFEETIFMVEVKSMKTVKFTVFENSIWYKIHSNIMSTIIMIVEKYYYHHNSWSTTASRQWITIILLPSLICAQHKVCQSCSSWRSHEF